MSNKLYFSLQLRFWFNEVYLFQNPDGLTDCNDPECCNEDVCQDHPSCQTVPDPDPGMNTNTSISQNFIDQLRFLYEGENATQIGVDPEAIDDEYVQIQNTVIISNKQRKRNKR